MLFASFDEFLRRRNIVAMPNIADTGVSAGLAIPATVVLAKYKVLLIAVGAIVAASGAAYVYEKMQECETRGYKRGTSDTSKEYKEKLKRQYKEFTDRYENLKSEMLESAKKDTEEVCEKLSELLGLAKRFLDEQKRKGEMQNEDILIIRDTLQMLVNALREGYKGAEPC